MRYGLMDAIRRHVYSWGTALSLHLLLTGVACSAHIESQNMSFNLSIPAGEIIQRPGGVLLSIDSKKFEPRGDVGDPAIPSRVYRIVLPATTVDESVQVSIAGVTATQHTASLLLPLEALRWKDWVEEREDNLPVVDGKNTAIYDADEFYPASHLINWQLTSSRGWRILDVELAAARCNPQESLLAVATQIQLSVGLNKWVPDNEGDMAVYTNYPVYGNTTYMERVVTTQGVQNWLSLLDDYQIPMQIAESGVSFPNYNYLIVTTDDIFNARFDNGLWDFSQHKNRYGYHPATITVETIYSTISSAGMVGDVHNIKVQQIHAYIENFYRNHGIEHVLLVGNPDRYADSSKVHYPDNDIVPMLKCETTKNGNTAVSYTDAYYADLFKSWDTDGDGIFGESWSAPGSPDLSVGRIAPVGGNTFYVCMAGSTNTMARNDKLKRVFHKMILYDLEIDKSWRYGSLLAGSYIFGSTKDAPGEFLDTVAQQILVHGGSSFWTHRLYQDGNRFSVSDVWHDGSPSPEATDDLAAGFPNNFTDYRAATPYGIVTWRNHGNYEVVAVGDQDTDTYEGSMLTANWVWNHPTDDQAFIESSACQNMNPGSTAYSDNDLVKQQESWANIATVLHYNRAVAITASTALGLTATGGNWTASNPIPGDTFWIQRSMLGEVAHGESFGDALKNVRDYLQAHYGINYKLQLKNFFRRTLLGDPSQGLFESLPADDIYEDNDSISTAHQVFDAFSTFGYSACSYDTNVWVRGLFLNDNDCFKLTRLGSEPKAIEISFHPDFTYQTGCTNDLLQGASVYVVDDNFRSFTVTDTKHTNMSTGEIKRVIELDGVGTTTSTALYVLVYPGRYAQSYDINVRIFGDYEPPRPTVFQFCQNTRTPVSPPVLFFGEK